MRVRDMLLTDNTVAVFEKKLIKGGINITFHSGKKILYLMQRMKLREIRCFKKLDWKVRDGMTI